MQFSNRAKANLKRRGRAFACFLAALSLTSVGLMATDDSPQAGAACNGTGNPYVWGIAVGGNTVAREVAAWPFTTCDNDYFYGGAVEDSYPDGSCAYVWVFEDGAGSWIQGYSCDGWSNYGYWDSIGFNNSILGLSVDYSGIGWQYVNYGY